MAQASSSKLKSPLTHLIRQGPRIAALPRRNVLEISGPDAQKFLKGLCCKDVDNLGGGYSGFLNASGRILHTVFIYPVKRPQPTYLITHESSPDDPSPLIKLLPPFRLRSKVKIRDVTSEWDVYASWGGDIPNDGPSRVWKLGSGGAAESHWEWPGQTTSPHLGDGEVGCWDLRAGWDGSSQLLTGKGTKPAMSNSAEMLSEEEYDLRRMILGLPEGQREIQPGVALPLESCMDIQGGVDFRKGCYLGQELTVRTYHTGATRKRILPISLFPLSPTTRIQDLLVNPAQSSVGAEGGEITYHPPASSASKKPRPAGKILSLHPSTSHVGLGLVRLEYAERVWWSGSLSPISGTTGDWQDSEKGSGTLTTSVNGVDWGVYVDQGASYKAALENINRDQNDQ